MTAAFSAVFLLPRSAAAYQPPSVPGENYEICSEQSQYLTSPWTYDALASGTQDYTVAQYEALSGYGTTLPPLPSYISAQGPSTQAAVIYAPGSAVDIAAYQLPETPIVQFYEGGAYGELATQSISGDEFIGGSAPGYPEPAFDDGGNAGGIDAGNDTYGFSGGANTLSATANAGATVISTSSPLAAYSNWITFSDGSTYQIDSSSGTTTTLASPLTNQEALGGAVWANSTQPIAEVSAGAAQGAKTITATSASIPLVPFGDVVIGDDTYQLTSVSGNQSSYTLGTAGLDTAVAANTPVYYADPAGGVTVEYLDINNDQHQTTGTINIGSGWTVEHNNIHDGNSKGPGFGVALYGGDESTIEYNCLARMGDYGGGGSGTNESFDYNEVLDDAYNADPGCGCSGGGKWWGTLNANIVDNAFVDDGGSGGQPAIWLDNGNAGTLIEGNYFFRAGGSALDNETGFNMKVDDNLFLDDGWGTGSGQSNNSDGAVNINSSGGFNVPGSRYEDSVSVSNNYFVNDWMGIDIWQSGLRSCLASGEGWPIDSAYCSGGFPNTDTTAANGQYYFSHEGDTAHGGSTTLAQPVSSGSSTVMVKGPEAIDDQIGFADPATTTTTDTTDVTAFSGSGTINATTTGFPTSGQLRVDTSAAGGGGGQTGAVLSYTGTTSSTFTGVALVRGTGTLTGAIQQIQPYKVTAETCYANDCALTVSPTLTSSQTTGTEVSNAGTCPLYATSVALPSGPLAPDSVSYWDGCQWQARDISVNGNNFVFQPSLIAAGTPPEGSATSTDCSATNNDSCGTNFMSYQAAGSAPYGDQTGGNAMMSSSSFTGCPAWDAGCTSDPLSNLNALANPPGATAGNGEAPGNNVWSDNTYSGPWAFYAYNYGPCYPLPADSSTGGSLPSAACGATSYSDWQSDWQQDSGSAYNPLALTLGSPTSGQGIHGPSQGVTAYEDTGSSGSITSHLQVNGSTVSTASVSSSPYSFSLDTLNYPDGAYTLAVNGTDTGDNTTSDQVPVYITNGDLNGDGSVNLSDLAAMAAHWGQTDPNYQDGNITGQSTINISDLAVMAANWGWSHP